MSCCLFLEVVEVFDIFEEFLELEILICGLFIFVFGWRVKGEMLIYKIRPKKI